MAKQTKALSGPAKRKFLQSIVEAEPGLEPLRARRLADRLDAAIAQVRARGHAALGGQRPEPPAAAIAEAATAPLTPTATPFDPHAFSLVVVMTKHGAAGLLQRLETIAGIAELRAIADAQHIDIGPTTANDIAALRAAMVAGTARRIADRRAAAS